MDEIKLCSYGCGKPGIHILKNGKFCCSESANGCIINKRYGNKNGNKYGIEIINLENLLCNYGCGKVAKFKFKNNNICCSIYSSKCSESRRKNSDKNKGENNGMFGKNHTERH